MVTADPMAIAELPYEASLGAPMDQHDLEHLREVRQVALNAAPPLVRAT